MRKIQTENAGEEEYTAIKRLISAEDLAEKKYRIFSRLLTDVALAQKMESLATRHEKRKTALLAFCGETGKKKTKEGDAQE